MSDPASNGMKKVVIHSDGGCSGNPGLGGWAAVLRHDEHVKELSGGATATTNNRMELQAAIEALRALKMPCLVEFFTDSKYVQQGISQWMFGWKKRGWMTLDKKPVKNDDLWRALDEAVQRHRVEWKWLKGHAGHADNERCDVLAGAEMAKIRREHTPQQLKAALAEFKQRDSAGQGATLL